MRKQRDEKEKTRGPKSKAKTESFIASDKRRVFLSLSPYCFHLNHRQARRRLSQLSLHTLKSVPQGEARSSPSSKHFLPDSYHPPNLFFFFRRLIMQLILSTGWICVYSVMKDKPLTTKGDILFQMS